MVIDRKKIPVGGAQKTASAGAADFSDRIPLPKRRKWPQTDGFINKQHLPATLVFREADPFTCRYEHWTGAKSELCTATWKQKEGQGRGELDRSTCPWCQSQNKAKAKIYITVSFHDEMEHTYLLAITITGYRLLKQFFGDVTDWNGVAVDAILMDIMVAGKPQKTVSFAKSDFSSESVDSEAPAEAPAEAKTADGFDEGFFDGLVKRFNGLQGLKLGKTQLRTTLERTLKSEDISTELYLDKLVEKLLS